MARTRPPDRLAQIADAAATVFADRGYRNAQMSDIARAAGVSSGSLYNYVESKDALLHLSLRHTFGREPLGDLPLPVAAPSIAAALTATGTKFVDVNSGVEQAPGIKSPAKLQAFVFALHNATKHDNPAYRP